MARSGFAHQAVGGGYMVEALADLLQTGLVVIEPQSGVVQVRGKMALHHRTRRFVAAFPVDAAQQRLQRRCQDGFLVPAAGVLLALAHPQHRADPQEARLFRQYLPVHQRRSHARKISFTPFGEPPHEHVADGQAQHRVAEELQGLVVNIWAAAAGYVGQTAGQQHRVPEAVTQSVLELLHLGGIRRQHSTSPHRRPPDHCWSLTRTSRWMRSGPPATSTGR